MKAFCPACGDDSIVNADGCCSWDGTRLISAAPLPTNRRVDAGRCYTAPSSLIDHAYHEWYIGEGLSLRQVAARVHAHPETWYSNERSCAESIRVTWQRRGYRLRDRSAARTRSNWKHGFYRDKKSPALRELRAQQRRATGETRGVACAGFVTSTGEPCRRPAMRDGDYCWAHADPARARDQMLRVRCAS